MFVNIDVLAQDFGRFKPTAYMRTVNPNKNISYVLPAGDMMLDDHSAIYATTSQHVRECSERAKPGINILCVGALSPQQIQACSNVNLLVLDIDESDYEIALRECAKVIAWYSDGLAGLSESVESGDKDAIRRATAILRYCLAQNEDKGSTTYPIAEQLSLALHGKVNSWQLFEETIMDCGWRLTDEYFCIYTMVPEKSLSQFFAKQHIGMGNGPIYVCLREDDYLLTTVNITRMGLTYHLAARSITSQLFDMAGNAIVGISNPFTNLQDIACYSRQAHDALKLSATAGESRGLSFFNDRYLDFVAAQCLKACPPSSLYPPGYERLKNMQGGTKKEDSLSSFLDIYIKNDFQMKPTIAGSYCSRTTAFEKLRKIKQISGMDLDDPNTRVALQIATRAAELAKRTPSLGSLYLDQDNE